MSYLNPSKVVTVALTGALIPVFSGSDSSPVETSLKLNEAKGEVIVDVLEVFNSSFSVRPFKTASSPSFSRTNSNLVPSECSSVIFFGFSIPNGFFSSHPVGDDSTS